eukprot:scaffold13706_cov121-Isochrysis_galbana.AAC.10
MRCGCCGGARSSSSLSESTMRRDQPCTLNQLGPLHRTPGVGVDPSTTAPTSCTSWAGGVASTGTGGDTFASTAAIEAPSSLSLHESKTRRARLFTERRETTKASGSRGGLGETGGEARIVQSTGTGRGAGMLLSSGSGSARPTEETFAKAVPPDVAMDDVTLAAARSTGVSVHSQQRSNVLWAYPLG